MLLKCNLKKSYNSPFSQNEVKMFSQTIVLNYRSKSRNQLDKMHWAEKRLLKKQYALLIRHKMKKKSITKWGSVPRLDLIIVCHRKRKLDFDNLVGGLKQLIDALHCEGFIFDDADDYVKMHISQVKDDDERIEITRMPLENREIN